MDCLCSEHLRDRRGINREDGMPGWAKAATALAIFVSACIAQAAAEDYPVRPVRMVVGFGPGAVADVIARAMAARMSDKLGQQIVIENRPGAPNTSPGRLRMATRC
jgi:hypothetical protein